MASKMYTYAQFKQTCTTTLASAISRDGVAREMLRSVTSGRKEASSEGADLTIVPELSLASVTWAVLSSVISSLNWSRCLVIFFVWICRKSGIYHAISTLIKYNCQMIRLLSWNVTSL